MPTVDVEPGRLLGEELRRHGVQVVTDVTVKAIGHQPGRLAASGEPDLTDAAGVVLVVVGVRPDSGSRWPLAWRPGVPGGLRVDRRSRTNLADILVAGDGVETYHRLLDRPAYLPLGTTAHQQGRVAGEACSAGSASPSAPPWPPPRGTPITTSDFEPEVAHNPAREPS